MNSSYIKIFLLLTASFVGLIPLADSIAVMSVDLGSEWLKIAIVKPGVPMEIALNKESRRKTPFVLALKGSERYFSDPAEVVATKQPTKAYLYLAHLIGKKFDSDAVKLYRQRFSHYKLFKDETRGTVLFEGDDVDGNIRKYSVEELLAMTLNFTRHVAEGFADHPMKDVVLTVPVYFNQAERRAVLEAASMSGLNVLQLINDNTAVALNYGIFRAATFNATVKNVMFYDMGASHTTVTIVGYSTVKVKDRGYVETVPQLVVKGIGFDTTLGGLEMDFRLRDLLVKRFKETVKTKGDITANARAMVKLLKEAKRVRQVLSANVDHNAQIEGLFEDKDFITKITRAELEEMFADLFARVGEPVKMALDCAAMTMADIDLVLLMGGGSRIPRVQEIIKEVTKQEELGKSINTDEAAALGAVYRAADLMAGFKVKRMIIKDLNLFPVDVTFDRGASQPPESANIITKNLYHKLNPLPQKKIMTFNKKPTDFKFNVKYGDLTFMKEDLKNLLDLSDLSQVELSGVAEAHEKNENATAKGVKAYFNIDESSILHLEKVEAHFEKAPEVVQEEEEQKESAFAKIGSTLSSFFGSGKKDEVEGSSQKSENEVSEEKGADDVTDQKKEEVKEPAKDEKEGKPSQKSFKGKKEERASDTPKAQERGNTTVNATAAPANQAEKIKPAITKEAIAFRLVFSDVVPTSKEAFVASVKVLNELEARDQAKAATEKALNSLESFILDFKDKLEQKQVQKLSTKQERTKIDETLTLASAWLESDGYDATEETLKSKLQDVKDATSDLKFRIGEFNERPQAVAALLSTINITNVFLDTFKTLPHAKEIYTEKDLDDLKKLRDESSEWLMKTWKKQNETSLAQKPVLLTRDVISRKEKIDRELMYLVNKAKHYVPKTKPKANEAEANTTKDDTRKSDSTSKSDKKKSSSGDPKAKSVDQEEAAVETDEPAEVDEEQVPVLEIGGDVEEGIVPPTMKSSSIHEPEEL